jgi:transcriptional regulator with XRE-family HTH domain
MGYVTAMVTQIRKSTKPRAFLKEHRKAAELSALKMAGRLGVERESVYRMERDPTRLSLGRLQQWAEACGLQSYLDLFTLPKRPKISTILDLPAEAQDAVMDMAARLSKLAS